MVLTNVTTFDAAKARKVSCPHCDHVATTKSNLKQHIARKHAENKPAFPCPHCDYVATRKCHLKQHIALKHAENKPAFPCPHCDHVATVKSSLKRHIKTIHLGTARPKNFRCDDPGCVALGVAYSNKSQLEQHRIAFHTKEGHQRRKKQEEAMKNALVLAGFTESFDRGQTPGPMEFCREHYFDHRCALQREFKAGEKKFAYVDFVVRCPSGRLVFLEVDEWQHESYSQMCETTRMQNICASIALSGETMNVFWLRFNPDRSYEWKGEQKHHQPAADRRRQVVALLKQLPQWETDNPMEVAYAFYNSKDGEWPDVLGDPEYANEVKPAVLAVHQDHARLQLPWKPKSLWPRAVEAAESDEEDMEYDDYSDDDEEEDFEYAEDEEDVEYENADGTAEEICVFCDDEPGSSLQHAAMSRPPGDKNFSQNDSDDGAVPAKRARV